MCILTFVETKDSKIITFTRDEDPDRNFENMKLRSNGLICPLDLQNKGTWIGCNGLQISMLQNGALEKHKRKSHYDKSRGLILMEILNGKKIDEVFDELKGMEIEPFTLSIFEIKDSLFTIYTYDGENSIKKINDESNSLINLSSTLYDNSSKIRIKNDFIKAALSEPDDLIDFHLKYKINQVNGISHPLVCSTSITQFVVTYSTINYKFINLLSNQIIVGKSDII